MFVNKFDNFSRVPKKFKVQTNNSFKKKDNLSLGYLDNEEVHELIEKIVSWYKVRFSVSNLLQNKDVGLDDIEFDDNFYTMTFEELMDRISSTAIESISCNYINKNFNPNLGNLKYNLGVDSSYVVIDLFTLKNKMFRCEYDKICFLIVDKSSGKIVKVMGDFLLPVELKNNYADYNLEDILDLLEKKSSDKVNYSSLKKCVNKHNNDILVREKIINMVCEKLLFDDNINFDCGYYIATTFLDDFSTFYGVKFGDNYLESIIDKRYKSANKSKNNTKKRVKTVSS